MSLYQLFYNSLLKMELTFYDNIQSYFIDSISLIGYDCKLMSLN